MATEEYIVGASADELINQSSTSGDRVINAGRHYGVTRIARDMFMPITREDESYVSRKLGSTNFMSRDGVHSIGTGGATIKAMHRLLIKEMGIADARWGGEFSMEGQFGTSDQFMNSFNRHYKIFPNEEIDSMLSYVFIVRPDLNINSAILADPYFQNLDKKENTILKCLTHDPVCNTTHHFIPFLLDRVKQYQLPDFNLKTYDLEQPFSSFKIQHGGNSNESRSGTQCSITFRDNKDLDVTNLFEAWVRYIDGLSLNRFYPKDEYLSAVPTGGTGIIDYATSVYYIKTKATGSEIVFYHKTTGLFPTNVPHSNWSFALGGSTDNDISVEFVGGFPEAFNPRILAEFNYNAGVLAIDESSLHGEMRIINNAKEFAHYSNPVTGAPFITCDPASGRYFLRWRPLA